MADLKGCFAQGGRRTPTPTTQMKKAAAHISSAPTLPSSVLCSLYGDGEVTPLNEGTMHQSERPEVVGERTT